MYTTENNSENPLSNTNQSLSPIPCESDENPSLKAEDTPWLLHFPSPFLDDNEMLFSPIMQHREKVLDDDGGGGGGGGGAVEISSENATGEVVVPHKGDADGGRPRKKAGKKDRHSKIFTSQGLRDRRMRLSLKIARRFFDLQDMLGFDKASKTIEWLFSKSKKAIAELAATTLPRIKNTTVSVCQEEASKYTTFVNIIPVENAIKKSRKSVERESRDKARARARERTIEKMKMRGGLVERAKENSSKSFEKTILGLEEESNYSNIQEKRTSSFDEASYSHSLEHQMSNVGIIDRHLGDYYQSNNDIRNFMGFLGNCEIGSNICEIDPVAGNIHGQNPANNSVFMATSSLHFQSRYHET